MLATSLLRAGDHLIVARPNYATNLETPRAIGADISILDLTWEDAWARRPGTHRGDAPTGDAPGQPDHAPQPDGPAHRRRRPCAPSSASWRRTRSARLLVDETYRELQDGPLPPLAASRSERVISVSSLSKAYGLPGIRLGWLVTRDEALRQTLLAAKEQIVITGSVVDETIGYEAVRRRDDVLAPIRARSAAALATTRRWMAGQDIFEWHEPRGGVVGFPRVRPGIELDMDRFYARLFEGYGTIVGPGHWFEQSDRSFRLGFGWPAIERCEEGLAALSAAASEQLG